MKTSTLLAFITMQMAWAFSSGQQKEIVSTLNVSGGNYANENYQFEWSIGEMASVRLLSGNTFWVTEGFCQPLVASNIANERLNALIPVRVFPNPAQTDLYIQGSGPIEGLAEMVITDIAGRPCYTKMIFMQEQWKERIDVHYLPAGKYYLTIHLKKDFLSTFRSYNIGWIKL
jgi:hypothetical protein